jgi:hypothetical protein
MEASLRTLMEGLIDYAGLYPPASLDMPGAVRNYAAYGEGPHARWLGRFVLPVARLEEFARARAALEQRPAAEPWRISALIGEGLAADLKTIAAFNRAASNNPSVTATLIDTVELKAATPGDVPRALPLIPASLTPYFEIPIQSDPAPFLAALSQSGARAKVRTGGVTPDLFPPPETLAGFIAACARAKVPFKATAGLHHPIRGRQKLTYADDSGETVMHGFVNVFLAAAFAAQGMDAATLTALLDEESPRAFDFQADAITWKSHRLEAARLRQARQGFALAFGSCSFEDPRNDLQKAGLL